MRKEVDHILNKMRAAIENSELVLVPEFDLELREFNLSLGKKIESEGGKVTYIVIKNIHPKTYSRLADVELKMATTC